MAAQFDVIVAEALDRISRDQEDVAGFFKRMSFAGVKIITLAEGEINDLHVGLKGTMNALFLKDLADKTRRGLRGRIEAGKSGGGNAYGYDVVHSTLANGTLARGDRRLNSAEVAIVLRIFEAHADGASPRSIAFALNGDGVPCPSGGTWKPSTINGNRERGTGILNNELYIGRMVWNRLRYAKNPDTGKRVSRLNPEAQWVIHDVPALRIVDDALWHRVKDRQDATAFKTRREDAQTPAFWQAQRPKSLLSGLIRCGVCGGAYSKISATLFGCATARNKGTCDNRLNIRGDKIEAQVLAGLSTQLLDPTLFQVFADEFYKELNRLRADEGAQLDATVHERDQIDRKLGKLVEAITEGGPLRVLTAEMQKLEDRRDAVTALLDAASRPRPPLIHTAIAAVYRQKVSTLRDTLANPALRDTAVETVRSLVEEIILQPVGGKLEIELRGALAGILSLCADARRKTAPADFSDEAAAVQVKMVAGTGFEPVTFRL